LEEEDLGKYATKFARIRKKQKGVFPYELFKDNTLVEELNKQDFFNMKILIQH
jgi:hypothetical protein